MADNGKPIFWVPEKKLSTIVSSTGTSTATVQFTLTGHEAKLRLHTRPPDDHNIYALVGRVASEWARIEHTLDLIISELATLPSPRMACITAQMMGVWPRYNSIIALLNQLSISEPKFEKYIAQVNYLSQSSRHTSERRNRIIHDPWYIDAATGITAQQKSMPKDDPKYKHEYGIKDVDRAEIDGTLSEIAKLATEAGNLRSDLLAELSS